MSDDVRSTTQASWASSDEVKGGAEQDKVLWSLSGR